jgi:7-carboxy-7-deazaguanine synthase
MVNHTANIVEIFSSLQGEGIYVGDKMTFVRFGSCDMRCRYCDTAQALNPGEDLHVERHPGSGEFDAIENPVSVTRLCELLERFDDEFISVTGGEPLGHAEFLAEWLPAVSQKRRVLLETNGVKHIELEMVIPHVHVVSMDIKLPSAAGCGQLWDEHLEFLRKTVAAGREVYVKLVVTDRTSDTDIQKAIDVVTRVNRFIPIVIQPASQTITFQEAISKERLQSVERLCSAYLENVRVVPQMHKEWGVL